MDLLLRLKASPRCSQNLDSILTWTPGSPLQETTRFPLSLQTSTQAQQETF